MKGIIIKQRKKNELNKLDELWDFLYNNDKKKYL